MYKLKCSRLGSPNCTFEATGVSREEVIIKMKDHARIMHASNLSGMTDSDVDRKFDNMITEE